MAKKLRMTSSRNWGCLMKLLNEGDDGDCDDDHGDMITAMMPGNARCSCVPCRHSLTAWTPQAPGRSGGSEHNYLRISYLVNYLSVIYLSIY